MKKLIAILFSLSLLFSSCSYTLISNKHPRSNNKHYKSNNKHHKSNKKFFKFNKKHHSSLIEKSDSDLALNIEFNENYYLNIYDVHSSDSLTYALSSLPISNNHLFN